ncbi:MAG: hypothetical protein H6739_28655 [Alphaproteobacteria bacterium]|nr:hypothetical protein [Alphaproteobacteria bacterium]
MSPLTLSLLLAPLALSAPADDPIEALYGRMARTEELPVLYGAMERGPEVWARALDDQRIGHDYYGGVEELVRRETDPEGFALEDPPPGWRPVLGVRGYGRLAVGNGRTQGLLGDAEDGLLSPRLGATLSASSPWIEARITAEARGDFVGGSQPVAFAVPTAWAGLHHGPLRVGFGLERRWLGPGRHGALILGDDAWPFPAGSLALEGSVWKLGRLRADVGAGWLQRERADVDRPGLLWMDFRWSPAPWLELGASRASLFAGEGRPWPGVGQLILPLDPHVYDDPDRSEPDQDEIAALDARLCVPLGRWMPVLDYVEVYTQYGGDDMIVRRFGPIPRPSLAGVANLFGAEVSAGPVAVTAEYARLLDDTFRWYRGHRVYHEGFSQDGRWLGHVNGGDQETLWAQVTVFPGPWGVEAWTEQVRRVGVVEVVQDTVFTLQVDEQRRRFGVRGWYVRPEAGRFGVGYELERITGIGFVPEEQAWMHRVWFEVRGSPWVIGARDEGGGNWGG